MNKKNNIPDISVVVPVYNGSDYIQKCIDSVRNQNYPNIELIVVDDGSTDGTKNILRNELMPKQYIFHSSNKGANVARNTGITHATGEYIAFLDSDDTWLSDKLRNQIELINEHGDDVVGTDSKVLKTTSLKSRKIFRWLRDMHESNLTEPVIVGESEIPGLLSCRTQIGPTSSLLIKREIVEDVGGFNPQLPHHQDYEFLIRILSKYNLILNPSSLVVKEFTGEPDIEKIERAKNKLLNSHQEKVARGKFDRNQIKKKHNADLAKYAFRRSEYKKGYTYIKKGITYSTRDILSIAGSGLIGVIHN